jgi:hypothetical protein
MGATGSTFGITAAGAEGRSEGPVTGGVVAHPAKDKAATPARTIAMPFREVEKPIFFIWFLPYLPE